MPRWASRIDLTIVSIRVERVREIGGGDIQEEGIRLPFQTDPYDDSEWLRDKFRGLWNSINAKHRDGIYAWERNPWVWVITFKRISEGVDHEYS